MLRLVKTEAPRFLRFALVGGAGFALDAGLLALLHNGAGLDPFSARVFSISIATFMTWRLNRGVTFGASARSQAHEGMRYATVAALAAGVNYLAYALALILWRGLPPIAALVVGTATGMVFSYAGYSRFVFSARSAIFEVGPSSQSR
jgi:putative flippase GtrA